MSIYYDIRTDSYGNELSYNPPMYIDKDLNQKETAEVKE